MVTRIFVANDSQLIQDTDAHLANVSNPHAVTKSQVGLANADNTSDANKPTSTAVQTALDLKSNTNHTHTGVYEPANSNIQTHIALAHAPSDAQKNSDITKAEIEAKLTGEIDSHTHAGGPGGAAWGDITGTLSDQTDLQTALDAKADDLGADDNYVTDAEKTKLSNITVTQAVDLDTIETNANNVPAIKTKTDHISVSQAVNLDTMESDIAGKQATLVSGTNIKTVNGNSLMGAGDVTVSGDVAITETEIDVGTTPVAEASISVTDSGVTTNSKIIGGVAYKAPTGKELDELEMDALEVKFEPLSGSLNIKIKGLEGPIADKFICWYTFA